jgi:hypothetical protein
MAGIDIVQGPFAVPTVCGPITDFQQLTTNSNAYTLGWIGFIMGAGAVVLFWIAVRYVGPWLQSKGVF